MFVLEHLIVHLSVTEITDTVLVLVRFAEYAFLITTLLTHSSSAALAVSRGVLTNERCQLHFTNHASLVIFPTLLLDLLQVNFRR